MTPTTQEYLHDPSQGQTGDCVRACLATLLDLPLGEVPHFAQLHPDTRKFDRAINAWLGHRGLAHLEANPFDFDWTMRDGTDVYHLIYGPSPRGQGVLHAVVGRNGRIEFDPHPDRSGLAGEPSEWTWGFLIHAGSSRSA